MDVHVTGGGMYGGAPYFYQVWVDGKIYESFTSNKPLTFSEQADVAAGYREALTVFAASA